MTLYLNGVEQPTFGGFKLSSKRVTTTDDTPTTILTIVLCSTDSVSLINVTTVAKDDTTSFHRFSSIETVSYQKISGSITEIFRTTRHEFNSVPNVGGIDFVLSGGNILVQITGVVGSTINWLTSVDLLEVI